MIETDTADAPRQQAREGRDVQAVDDLVAPKARRRSPSCRSCQHRPDDDTSCDETEVEHQRKTSSRRAASCCSETPPTMASRISPGPSNRSEEHTSELPSLMSTSYAVFCSKKQKPR